MNDLLNYKKKKLINEYFRENEKIKKNIKYDSIRNYIEEYFIFSKGWFSNNLVDVLNESIFWRIL